MSGGWTGKIAGTGSRFTRDDVSCCTSFYFCELLMPKTIKTDNGSEFISNVMDNRAYERGVELNFSRPGKLTDNARVEKASTGGCASSA